MTLTVEQIWQRYDADEVRLSAPLSLRMLQLGNLRPGMNVLDLATGRGEPAVRACKLVAPVGQVVGLDIAPAMLAMAAKRAQAEDVHNLQLITTNAERPTELPDLQFDVVLARWGLMYMNDPPSALREAGQRCRPGAQLIAALWAEPERVDYYTLPRLALAKFAPVTLPVLNQPGPFRYSQLDGIQQDFQAAGWKVHHVEELYVEVMEATSSNELVDWCRCFGMNRLLEHVSPEIQQQWEHELIDSSRTRRDPQGVVRLGGVTRLVVASWN